MRRAAQFSYYANRSASGLCRPLPRPKGAVKGIGIFVTRQVSYLIYLHLGLGEILADQLLPSRSCRKLAPSSTIRRCKVRGSTEFLRYGWDIRPATRDQPFQNPLHLLAEGSQRMAFVQDV